MAEIETIELLASLADFGSGKWIRREELKEPGHYPAIPNDHFPCDHFRVEIIYEKDGRLWQATAFADEENPIPWRGWFWSKPLPRLPYPPEVLRKRKGESDG